MFCFDVSGEAPMNENSTLSSVRSRLQLTLLKLFERCRGQILFGSALRGLAMPGETRSRYTSCLRPLRVPVLKSPT